MKRTGLKRVTPLKASAGLPRLSPLRRAKGLKPRSAKVARLYVERRALVAEALADRPRCELQFPGCWGEATCVDEIKQRSRGGSIVDPANTVPSCGPCNTYKEDHPGEAEARGLSRHSWDSGDAA